MSCKIDEVAEKYGLATLDQELLAAHEEGKSLRELETQTNRTILQQVLREAGEDPLPGEVENLYELLTDEDVSEGTAVHLRDRLSRADVDTDAVARDFVSYQTVRTHLRECLDTDTGTETAVSLDDERETMFSLLGRAEVVVENSLARLREAGTLAIGPVEATANVRVVCSDCNRSYTLSTLLSRRSCACHEDDGDGDPATADGEDGN